MHDTARKSEITVAMIDIKRWLLYRLPVLIGPARRKKVEYLGFSKSDDGRFAEYGRRKETSKRLTVALEWLADETLLPERFSILDVGCGPGAVAHLIRNHERLQPRVQYSGLEQSAEAAGFCRRTGNYGAAWQMLFDGADGAPFGADLRRYVEALGLSAELIPALAGQFLIKKIGILAGLDSPKDKRKCNELIALHRMNNAALSRDGR